MRINVILLLSSLFLIGACQSERSAEVERPPNFVILFADDLGYGDLGVYGNDSIRTPHLDRLAAEGLRFTDFYSASPACTASRYALLTGRYPAFSGFSWVLYPASLRGIHSREQTIAERLQAAGYATACFGKWHLGTADSSFLPLQNGFDEYMGLPYSNDMIPPQWPDIALLEGNDTLEMNPGQTLLRQRYTQRAIDFIDRNRQRPFFLYLPYAMPHVPLHPGPKFAGQSPRGAYGDVVEEIDWSVGEIRKALKDRDLAENTLLIFTSDNGPWIIKGRQGGSAGPLRDGKGSTWEGGMREPAIAWWPGTIAAGTLSDFPASTLDLYPTLLQLAGQRPGPDYPADGRDISSLLKGTDSLPVPRAFFYHGPDNRLQAVRSDRWKLHIQTNSQTGKQYFEEAPPLLFNLVADPGETDNLASEHPEVVKELLTLIDNHQTRLDTTLNFFEVDRQARYQAHIGLGKKITMASPPSPRYGDAAVLVDGLPGDPGDLQTFTGVQQADFQCTLDLGEALMAEKLRINFLHLPDQGVFLPENAEFFISLDGRSYKSRGILDPYPSWEEVTQTLVPYEIQMRAQPVRYVKIVAKNRQRGPAGHESAGQPVWLMADELWVE
jgi:arylsulfatase A